MTDCERTSLYFDGELPPTEEATALDHLAGCARCQTELGDWIGIATAMSRSRAAPSVAVAPGRRRTRWWIGGGVALAATAAVAVLVLGRMRPVAPPPPPAIALAETRSLEARVTAPAFDRHRPYRVERGAQSHEVLRLGVLADLDRRGDRAGLAAAHLLAGDAVHAAEVLEALPASARRDSDRAAAALIAGEPVVALQRADDALAQDPALGPALWNRALALRALDLPLAAAAALDAVVARGEPGWSDEARARAAALRAPFANRSSPPAPKAAGSDAWIAIEAARRDATLRSAGGDLIGGQRALLATEAACRDPALALPCGNAELDLAAIDLRLQRLDDAEARLRAARTRLATTGAPEAEDRALVVAAELEHLRGREGVAAAYREEHRLRALR